MYSSNTSDPDILGFGSGPCVSDRGEGGLDLQDEVAIRRGDIDTITDADEYVAVVCNAEAVREPLLLMLQLIEKDMVIIGHVS